MRDTAINLARNIERESPLINQGLAGKVAAIVKKWPVVTWDEDHGVVTVEE